MSYSTTFVSDIDVFQLPIYFILLMQSSIFYLIQIFLNLIKKLYSFIYLFKKYIYYIFMLFVYLSIFYAYFYRKLQNNVDLLIKHFFISKSCNFII